MHKVTSNEGISPKSAHGMPAFPQYWRLTINKARTNYARMQPCIPQLAKASRKDGGKAFLRFDGMNARIGVSHNLSTQTTCFVDRTPWGLDNYPHRCTSHLTLRSDSSSSTNPALKILAWGYCVLCRHWGAQQSHRGLPDPTMTCRFVEEIPCWSFYPSIMTMRDSIND